MCGVLGPHIAAPAHQQAGSAVYESPGGLEAWKKRCMHVG